METEEREQIVDKDKHRAVFNRVLGIFGSADLKEVMQGHIDAGESVVLTMTADRVWITEGNKKAEAYELPAAYDDFVRHLGLYGLMTGDHGSVQYGFESGWEARGESCIVLLKDLESTYEAAMAKRDKEYAARGDLLDRLRIDIEQHRRDAKSRAITIKAQDETVELQKKEIDEHHTKIEQQTRTIENHNAKIDRLLGTIKALEEDKAAE